MQDKVETVACHGVSSSNNQSDQKNNGSDEHTCTSSSSHLQNEFEIAAILEEHCTVLDKAKSSNVLEQNLHLKVF